MKTQSAKILNNLRHLRAEKNRRVSKTATVAVFCAHARAAQKVVIE